MQAVVRSMVPNERVPKYRASFDPPCSKRMVSNERVPRHRASFHSRCSMRTYAWRKLGHEGQRQGLSPPCGPHTSRCGCSCWSRGPPGGARASPPLTASSARLASRTSQASAAAQVKVAAEGGEGSERRTSRVGGRGLGLRVGEALAVPMD